MRLLSANCDGGRLAVHPDSAESEESSNGGADATDPRPSTGDDETSGPLVVGDVTDADGALLVDGGEEGPLVVDEEVEDAVLVGQREGSAVDGGVLGRGDGGEVKTMEGGQHAELELEGVGVGEGEWVPGIPGVFRQGDAVGLAGKKEISC